MKQELYINQANFMKQQIRLNKEKVIAERDKKELTEHDFKCSRSRLNGSFIAVDLEQDKSMHDQIMYNIKLYSNAIKTLNVNPIDKQDPNIYLFHTLAGSVTTSMILLTSFDNPQSCCPINKEIVLNNSIRSLELKLEEAKTSKNKKDISSIKSEIDILSKQYQENIKFL